MIEKKLWKNMQNVKTVIGKKKNQQAVAKGIQYLQTVVNLSS